MKNFRYFAVLLLVMFSTTILAHHPAEGIVDDEVYEMIDGMVADTPHADLTFDVMDDVTETTITSRTLVSLDTLMDDGLLTYLGMLDGDVSVEIDFNDDRSITMTITQTQ